MLRERIDVSGVTRDAGAPTGLYFVTHGPDGHVFTYRRSGSAASLMTANGLDHGLLRNTKILHASGISQAISVSAAAAVAAAMAEARNAGATISYDTNYRPRLWRCCRSLAGHQGRGRSGGYRQDLGGRLRRA